MIEVEVKLPVFDRESTEQRLSFMGFVKGALVRETDIYYNSEIRDFRKSDEALRIRICENLQTDESKTVITYKGPKLDNISMTRKELETKVGDADVCGEILASVGFHPVFPVKKLRQYYHFETMTACVDQVEGLGDFLELEVIVPEEKDREEALSQIERLLEGMGRNMEETTRVSYLSMLQKKVADGEN